MMGGPFFVLKTFVERLDGPLIAQLAKRSYRPQLFTRQRIEERLDGSNISDRTERCGGL